MTTSTAIDLGVRSNLAMQIAPQADSQESLHWLPDKGAHAGRLTGTKLGEVPASTFVEDSIVRNELLLTLVEQRRSYLLATESPPHLQERHLDQLDSWEASIQLRLASAWDTRHRSGL